MNFIFEQMQEILSFFCLMTKHSTMMELLHHSFSSSLCYIFTLHFKTPENSELMKLNRKNERFSFNTWMEFLGLVYKKSVSEPTCEDPGRGLDNENVKQDGAGVVPLGLDPSPRQRAKQVANFLVVAPPSRKDQPTLSTHQQTPRHENTKKAQSSCSPQAFWTIETKGGRAPSPASSAFETLTLTNVWT